MYNLYNLEPDNSSSNFENLIRIYKVFLNSENISKGSTRSYLSDVRHFLNWLLSFLEQNRISPQITNRFAQIRENPLVIRENQITVLLKFVNQKVLDAYKDYQTGSNTPLKTINRRFSSLRRFGSFCKSQNWCTLNPFEILKNVPKDFSPLEDKYYLKEFGLELWQNGASKLTTKNYLNDVKQFLTWVDSHGSLADFHK